MAEKDGHPAANAVALGRGATGRPRTTKKEKTDEDPRRVARARRTAPLARAEEVWRWRDANGTLCYSNRAAIAPRDAEPVKTRLIVEAKSLPAPPTSSWMTGW